MKSLFNMIHSCKVHAATIVNASITFSYRGILCKEMSNINEFIDNTFLFLKSKIETVIEVIRDFQLNQPVPVYKDKIHQVLPNIIDNSIFALNEANQKNKTISLKTFKSSHYAVIEIENNGPSIKEEHLNQVFDPFFTTKHPEKGTGLGLSICYSIVHEHQGYISAQNTKNGVVFNIELPLKMK